MMNRSSSTPDDESGRMAANEMAAMDHQLMPWLPVWLATITGRVLASVEVSSDAKKYSFQVSTSDRTNAATMPGRAMGRMIRDERAPDPLAVHQRGLLQLRGDGHELVAHDPDDDGQDAQRIQQDEPEVRVEQRRAPCTGRGTAAPAPPAAG